MRRRIALYFAWDRSAETETPLDDLNNRLPALFEVRRQFWPAYEPFAAAPAGQGIDGFVEAIFLKSFARFGDLAAVLTGRPVRPIQRSNGAQQSPLDAELLGSIDTLIILSFDSLRTGQAATPAEVGAVRDFLARPETMLFVCPHHDIGDTDALEPADALARQAAEFHHHGDVALPGQQRLGGFAVSLMAGLGAPIRNRFGLRPARADNGDPAPYLQTADDRFGLLKDVGHFNLHPHLPQFERIGAGIEALEVLARVRVQEDAPPHPFVSGGEAFDAILQATPQSGLGRLVVCDPTLWSSAGGGLQGLQMFWKNLVEA